MHKETNNTFLPVSVNITGKKILIVGGGKVGFHKATILSRYTQQAVVVSPEFRDGFAGLPFVCVNREYCPSDLDGAFLVYACTENEKLNRKIYQDAAERGVLVSVCDDPSLCDVISPAICKIGDLTISVSSNGKDVKRSIRIRNRINELIEKGLLSIE
jgi:siroheme synthase-like protein